MLSRSIWLSFRVSIVGASSAGGLSSCMLSSSPRLISVIGGLLHVLLVLDCIVITNSSMTGCRISSSFLWKESTFSGLRSKQSWFCFLWFFLCLRLYMTFLPVFLFIIHFKKLLAKNMWTLCQISCLLTLCNCCWSCICDSVSNNAGSNEGIWCWKFVAFRRYISWKLMSAALKIIWNVQ